MTATTTIPILQGGGPLFERRDRCHICASTAAATMVMRLQTQQCQMTGTMDVLGGPARDASQLCKSVEVCSNDTRDGRGGGGHSGAGGYWL